MPDAKDKPCTTYQGALQCFVEHDEWIMADAFVNPSHTIIEFGARYGTTSCRLARLTNNSATPLAALTLNKLALAQVRGCKLGRVN